MPIPEGSKRPQFSVTVEVLAAKFACKVGDRAGLPPSSRIVDVEWDGKNGCVIFYYEPK